MQLKMGGDFQRHTLRYFDHYTPTQAFDENGIKFAFPTVQVAGGGEATAAAVAREAFADADDGTVECGTDLAQLPPAKIILDKPVDPDAISRVTGAFEDFDVSGSQLVRSSHRR